MLTKAGINYIFKKVKKLKQNFMKLEFYISPNMRKLLSTMKEYEIRSVAVGRNQTNQRFIPIKIEILEPAPRKKRKK